MAESVAAASCRAHAWRLLVLLTVLVGLVPGVRSAPASDRGVFAGAGQAVWDADCVAPPRLTRVVEQAAVPVVESCVLAVALPSPVVVRARGRAGAGAERLWFSVSRAGRAPPFSAGV